MVLGGGTHPRPAVRTKLRSHRRRGVSEVLQHFLRRVGVSVSAPSLMALRATAAHLGVLPPARGSTMGSTEAGTGGARPRPVARASATVPAMGLTPLQPLSDALPWGRLVVSPQPLAELVADPDCAAALQAALLEHGVLCFRPSGRASEHLLTPDEYSAVMAALNPAVDPAAAASTAAARERMKTYESTPVDVSTDAADPAAASFRKAHVDGHPHGTCPLPKSTYQPGCFALELVCRL